VHGEACRLAFCGRLCALLDPGSAPARGQGAQQPQLPQLQRLRVFKLKERRGQIDRLLPDGCMAICKGLFKKESDLGHFVGLKVRSGWWWGSGGWDGVGS
jgi:selenocysteine-specific elongation factor